MVSGGRDLDGRVALVTGAARRQGIGRATALRLAARGAAVACLDVGRPPAHAADHGVGTLEELDETVELVRASGSAGIAVAADVSDVTQMIEAAARTRAELGPVWACCAIAGGVGFGNGIVPLLELTEAEWDWSVDVNLKGVWATARACVPHMVEAGQGGRVVTVTSAAGLRGARNFGAYAAAKAGVIALTRSFALELGRWSITANSVAPGMIETQASQPVREHLAAREGLDEMRRAIPLGRFGSPDEIAAAISFLCSDDAAYITGDVVNLTGGQVMS
jgi:meso-butanediol dehydrogenase/(S,S)-butanediol dehydrogenase/diacetyl reductase